MVVAVDAVNRNAVPGNTAAEERLIAATRWLGGSSAAPRPGRVPGPATAGVVTVLTSPIRWSISPAAYVLSDGVGGVYEVIWTTAKSENFPTAPGAGTSRIDWLMLEAVDTTSPSVHTAQLKLYSGTASSGTPPDPTGYPATALKIGSFATPSSGSPVFTPSVIQRSGLVGATLSVANGTERTALDSSGALFKGIRIFREDLGVEQINPTGVPEATTPGSWKNTNDIGTGHIIAPTFGAAAQTINSAANGPLGSITIPALTRGATLHLQLFGVPSVSGLYGVLALTVANDTRVVTASSNFWSQTFAVAAGGTMISYAFPVIPGAAQSAMPVTFTPNGGNVTTARMLYWVQG